MGKVDVSLGRPIIIFFHYPALSDTPFIEFHSSSISQPAVDKTIRWPAVYHSSLSGRSRWFRNTGVNVIVENVWFVPLLLDPNKRTPDSHQQQSKHRSIVSFVFPSNSLVCLKFYPDTPMYIAGRRCDVDELYGPTGVSLKANTTKRKRVDVHSLKLAN